MGVVWCCVGHGVWRMLLDVVMLCRSECGGCCVV